MAAEVPVSDLLCEAMEYLSKLGLNMHTRSENLKVKRISKAKLKNAHAVERAANKALLICELSKKSLENVVTGVRKVLSHVHESQASSNGGKCANSSKNIENKSDYHFFTYQSRKLKIPKSKRIPLKHFMSVKVLTKRMSLSKQDKYPLYYDCNLYRLRNKPDETATLKHKSLCEQVSSESKIDETVDIHSASDHIENDNTEESTTPKSVSSMSQSHSDIHLDKSKNNDIEGESNSVKHLNISEKSKNELELKKCQKRKFKKVRVIDDSSNSSEEVEKTDNEKTISTGNTPKKNENIVSDSERDSKIEKSGNSDNNETSESGESHKSSLNKPTIKCVNIAKLLKPDVLKSDKVNPSTVKNKPRNHRIKSGTYTSRQKDSNINNDLIKGSRRKSEQEYWEKKRKEAKAFSPKRFVINIDRLPKLSENFLHSHNLKLITQEGSILCEVSNKTQDASDISTFTDNSKSIFKHSLESHTKSKKPQLKQIEDVNKVKNALLYDTDSDDNHSNKDLTAEAEKVKNALLNDSDDDHSNKELTAEAEKVKNALLNESDSDNNEKSDENDPFHPKSGNTSVGSTIAPQKDSNVEQSNIAPNEKTEKLNLPNDSSSVDAENQSRECENTDKMDVHENNSKNEEADDEHADKEVTPTKHKIDKSSQSSDDIARTPLSQRKKRKWIFTPQSKRKHIMESMHAKKMLLTYSSSDTEDEQLKKALNEIKKSLLKGASSDEEISVDKKHRKRVSSSSSSDISPKLVYKNDHSSSPNSSDSDKKSKKKSNRDSDEEKLEGHSRDQNKDNMDEQSNSSSSSKMVRSKAKPGNCSSQNSDNRDTSDKEIDGLTNLNKLNASHRRRVSASSDKTVNSNTREKSSNAPKTSLIGEEYLQSESSDAGAASLAGSDGELEELPPVPIQKLNGSGLQHLAKDELLGESDSSISHNEKDKSSEEFQKEDETDEESVKLKRRKNNAISSDSEAGSSRRKLAEKLSDFEDSEDEGSESKRKRKKKAASDSDASGGSSSNGSKKKRRRIKQLNEDSDVSGSDDSETEGRNKHGRKNIRKVMGKNQLEEATKKAAREEKERIARITERQKLYNNLQFDESGKPDEVVLDKVVLDFDPETKDPLIEVDRGLVKKLKPHQANGIKFMWDACFESVKRIKKDKGSGCILAHCMGLGKTLQVVSLTHTLLTHSSLTNVHRVLVVCPLSTVLNWVNEFRMWLKHSEADYEVDVYELSRYKQNSERAYQLQSWFSGGGVCVLGYEMFRNLSADNNKKYKKKMLRNFQESLVDPGPDLVVCDEGHLLKNEKTSLSQSMNRVKTRRRIVLTGTPLQNNLKEYYCMVQFVKPNLLGKYNEYLNRFVNPITNGQYTDSTEHDIRIMKRRSHVLHKMLDGAVQRRDYGVLAPFLPPKHEYVLFITLAEVQTKLYQFYLDNYSRRPLAGKSSGFLFPDFQSLQRIWTHPLVLKYNSERYEIMQQKKREREEEDSEGSLVDFIDDDSTPDESSTEESSDDLSDASDDSRKKSKKKKSAKKGKNKDPKYSVRRGTRANPVEMDDDVRESDDVVEVKNENPTEWWIKLVTEEEIDDMRNSHKLVLLFDILRQCEAIGDKLLVFSQSLYSLDLIEHFLGKVDEATQEGRIDEKLGSHVGSWSPGVDYFRLDGSTSCENRSIWCKNFNREDNPRARLFLISTRAGGLGINLVAANRVVIFDVSWNPSHDVQSIFRVYRFGQKKPCYVYRFLAMGTMEEKIYERQVTKQAISKRVIDEQQIDRHYAENDLAELYKFEPQPPQPRPLPPLPKDRLFAEMLREHEAQIYKYHEHDSLLENKEEETLSEEERKAAWEDFENEKNKPPPAPFPSPWPMHNGMVPGLLAQQQQLAYAALAAMLRKDMPNMNDNQIRDMLPLIYNSNPGLMQKMGEIYKYAQQPGMMNPAMMNSVMNQSSAGGAGGVGSAGGMSGSSGLQYEPPWQRQHQQQQQIRLQQLMQQQQNQMGAKFYAGGLGSRDPVAMALQQQRAREIMLGGGTGGTGATGTTGATGATGASRPRGRPPMQPRVPAPPAFSNDVVDLDSD